MTKTFFIYRSSAGSGKTRTLAKEYLKLALRFREDYFKYILAVTFTNKASQEMKDRILQYLDDFANGRSNELAEELQRELGFDRITFQQHSQEAQAAILHQYDQFGISTIDAFFQKVIRSFTRESGLVGDYRLEVEQDAVLEEVVNNLIDELGTNQELTDWVVDFAKENLENERAWDVRFSLIEFSREIFREEFKAIEDQVNRSTGQPGFFKDLKSTLWSIKNSFLSNVSRPAAEALSIIQKRGWTVDDFYFGKGSGLLTFFERFATERRLSELENPGTRIRTHFTTPANWPNKKTSSPREIIAEAQTRLVPLLNQILSIYDADYQKAVSADLALKNLYVFGLISDIARKLKEYKDENNLMLLADAPKFLNGVIQDSDTPFIYEKVGSFYRNYLIDEFQDTSGMQWKNFQPLIVNALDQGHSSIVVGDVKQAIYRWRGGDLKLLQQDIEQHIGAQRVATHELDHNYRSAFEIVNFNNELFKTASTIVSFETSEAIASAAYQDVTQKISRQKDGFVHIQFVEPVLEETEDELKKDWKQEALHQMTAAFEKLQAAGASLRDIAFLVRKNDEGQRIAAHLLRYKTSPDAKPGCRYDVVSNESLRMDGAASVNLLLGAMYYLLNPDDGIARAQLGYEFARIHEPSRPLPDVFAVANQSIFENNLPPEFARQKLWLKKLSLIELTETLIHIFKLGTITGELAYLQAFQDLVLDFNHREKNDLAAFLEWWEDNKHKKSIQISGEVDAAQILTIHKSKGLQFRYVIIPFCSWSLDHDNWQAPNLWVSAVEKPFQNFGYFPVRYGKNLKETYFKDFYNAEFTRTYLDNLNLLYVALTRAEKGLVVFAPSSANRGAKDSVARILVQSIERNENLAKHWNKQEQTFKTGEWHVDQQHRQRNADAVELKQYYTANWNDKLVIKTSGNHFFADTSSPMDQARYGVYMHTVLSKIKYWNHAEEALKSMVMEGVMLEDDKQQVMKELDSILSIEQVKQWFDEQWTVRTEVAILSPGGFENRVDRLITQNKKAIVIDFKTGARSSSDNRQVLEYMQLMRDMNFIEVEGYLLYLQERLVVEVKAGGKQKAVKKSKDKDQLSLGF